MILLNPIWLKSELQSEEAHHCAWYDIRKKCNCLGTWFGNIGVWCNIMFKYFIHKHLENRPLSYRKFEIGTWNTHFIVLIFRYKLEIFWALATLTVVVTVFLIIASLFISFSSSVLWNYKVVNINLCKFKEFSSSQLLLGKFVTFTVQAK